MKRFVYILAVSILTFSFVRCTNEKKSNDQKNVTGLDYQTVRDSCDRIIMNDVLYNCINDYISCHSIMSPPREWMYYSLLFFKENNKNYFTIWFFVVFPDIVISKQVDTTLYDFNMDIIHDRKVVFINRKDENFGIFKSTKESGNLAMLEQKKSISSPIYDGDWYFQTFEIIQNKDYSYSLVKMDSANIFFNPTADGLTKIPVVSPSKSTPE